MEEAYLPLKTIKNYLRVRNNSFALESEYKSTYFLWCKSYTGTEQNCLICTPVNKFC